MKLHTLAFLAAIGSLAAQDLAITIRGRTNRRSVASVGRCVLQDCQSLLMDSVWKIHPADQSLEPRLGPNEIELGSRIQIRQEPGPLLVGFFQGV